MGQLRKVMLVRLENTQKMEAGLERMQDSQKIQATLVRLQNNQKVHTASINMKRIVNNTVISLAGQLVTWISTLLLTIAYGRFLGDFKFGKLYFAITFLLLIGFTIAFGFTQQLTRHAAQEPAKALHYLPTTLAMNDVLW